MQVVRAGDVIPYVLGPMPERRTGDEKPWRIPKRCPRCNTPTHRYGDDVATYCPNVACPGRQLEGLVHFVSKDAMDIDGLSYARIQQLLEAGLVHDFADLYDITVDELVALERFAKKSAENLVGAIQASKAQPLSRLLFGLGIRQTREDATKVVGMMSRLVTGRVSVTNLGGPISIAAMAGAEASRGWSRLLIFLTFLSANLAVLNFMPVPALDGGHIT